MSRLTPTIIQMPQSGGERLLDHAFAAALPELAEVRRRRQLRRHPLWRAHGSTIDALLDGFEWRTAPQPHAPTPGDTVRAVAWNIERGKRFDRLIDVLDESPTLAQADLIMLTEVDIGMARSGNRNVARMVADHLGVNYVYANHHLVLSPGDWNERDQRDGNTLAMHGSALLSRFPIRRVSAVALPEYIDKFHALEKRLGCKRTLLAEVELPDGPLTVAVVHLDPFAPPRHRAWQMRLILDAIARFGGGRVLLGGDLNTTTYNLANGPSLVGNIALKLATLGPERIVAEYLDPASGRERPVFAPLRRAGFAVEPFNEPEQGTLFVDTHDPELVRKALDYMPERLFLRLRRMLDPWDGVLPLRLDWFAGRGVRPEDPHVVVRPRGKDGGEVSDHSPIVVELRTAPAASPILLQPVRAPRRRHLTRLDRLGQLRRRPKRRN